MTTVPPRRTLCSVRSRPAPLHVFGVAAMSAIVVVSLITEPQPGLTGDGPLVALAVAVLVAGIALSIRRRPLALASRLGGLLCVAAAAIALIALQPSGIAYGALYYVVVVSALRLEFKQALAVSGVAVIGISIVAAMNSEHAAQTVISVVASVIPWFLVIRLVVQLDEGREEAEELVEELRESRAAHVESAALAERGRVARDMHDVLAHSLSALALQLESARLLARDRDADPDVVDAISRAHHLAADGLAEARDAIAALRGDELPGPERLQHLAERYPGDCEVTVTGAPRELESEARLAVYRTAQEALTNVLRHSAADRVEIRLSYEADGTRLVVQDYGPGAPVVVGSPGGGYGLTGMRERAELLGGRLSAGPTDDGYRVELWLP